MPGSCADFFNVFTTAAASTALSTSSKNVQPSATSCASGLPVCGMASTESVTGNQPFVAPSRMAGTFAMIAPTVGPFVGGWLTQTYSWHWIFLINVVPGILVCAVVGFFIPVGKPNIGILRKIDYATVLLAALFLGSLELLLKEAPPHHWSGLYIYALFTTCAASGSLAGYLCLSRPFPFVDLTRFARTPFAVGCSLSFVAGMGLYGSTYILAIFLGGVREHTPIEIGEIIMVSGAVQLLAAPVAALLESRVDGRLLLAFGYGLFGIGLLIDGQLTYQTDFDGLFWPQVLRGVAVMFCILPTTRLAMEGWNTEEAPDASGQFNLMRNLGGAIGIALIDTILAQRTPAHAKHIIDRLQAGDALTAAKVGLPTEYFHGVPMGPVDPSMRDYVEPLIQRAALVDSFNEAWIVLGVLFLLSLIAVLFVRGGTWQPWRTKADD